MGAFRHLVQSACLCFDLTTTESISVIKKWLRSPAVSEDFNIVLSCALAAYAKKNWAMNIYEHEEGDRTRLLRLCRDKIEKEIKDEMIIEPWKKEGISHRAKQFSLWKDTLNIADKMVDDLVKDGTIDNLEKFTETREDGSVIELKNRPDDVLNIATERYGSRNANVKSLKSMLLRSDPSKFEKVETKV